MMDFRWRRSLGASWLRDPQFCPSRLSKLQSSSSSPVEQHRAEIQQIVSESRRTYATLSELEYGR